METPFFSAGLAFLASLPQETIVFLAAKDMGKDTKDVITLTAAGLNPSLAVANRVFKTGDLAFLFNQEGTGSAKVNSNMKDAVSALLLKQTDRPLPKAASLRVAAERFWGCFLDMPQAPVDESFMKAACGKLKVPYKAPSAASEPKAVTEAKANVQEAHKQLLALSVAKRDIASICAATKKLVTAMPPVESAAGSNVAANALMERVTADLARMEAGLQAAKRILQGHVATVKAAHPSRIDVLLKALDEALRADPAAEAAPADGAAGKKRPREEESGKGEEDDPSSQQAKAGGDCVVQ